jgi:long-chain acyl-CoA synthetase
MSRREKPWLGLYEGRVSSQAIEGSLGDFLAGAVDRFGKQVALTDGKRAISYADLWERCDRLAAALSGAGVSPGDRVALMLPNCAEYVVAFFAVARAGAIVTQVNPLYVQRELEHILADSGASVIVVDAAAYPRVREVQDASALRTVVVVGEPQGGLGREAVDFDRFVVSAVGDPPDVVVDPVVDVAVIQYTGATTGAAKGAMHTHASFLGAVQQTTALLIEDADAYPENAKTIAVAPLFHIFGTTMVLLLGLRLGWNLVLVPRFEPLALLELIRRERPVMLAGVATIFAAFNAQPDLERYELDRVRLFVSGGAAVPRALAQAFEARTGRPIWEGYGLSEAAPVSFNTYLAPARGGTGVPVPGTDVRIVDLETGMRDLPIGEPGELLVLGPQVMKGYWQRPDETAAVLTDGWLHTGDVARIEPEGYLEIVDRKKEMINASGYKVYPREVEEVIYRHPDVAEVLVIGVPDQYRGETVKAFVALRPGGDADTDAIIVHCRSLLAPYKVPRIVEFRDSLPKSAVGKLLRRVLVEEERAKSEPAGATTT